MLKIGEFAGLTGLSVKALRHYDEKGVLVPADVDERSSYRRYSEAQVRAGVVIRALRDAGMPLSEVSEAIESGQTEAALAAQRRRVREQRESEDRAFSAAEGAIRALAVPVSVSERTMPAQPFVGQAITVPLEEAEALSDEDANQVFGALFARIQASGLGPSGQFWTALRAGEGGTVEVVCCWPTSSLAPEHTGGPESFSAVLPARTELVATWRPVEGEELPEGILHPAVVGLFDSIADRDLSLGDVEVRQTVLGQSEHDYAVEVSVTVE
jgi:DNA-binding transcriptional MerR regulator